jgi:S1-C subfamily serine protease
MIKMNALRYVFFAILSFSTMWSSFVTAYAEDQIPVAAPMTTDLSGGSKTAAYPSVFRVLCPRQQSGGTGFLHKSGKIITAFHVVSGCTADDIVLLGIQGEPIKVGSIVLDADVDLALLGPTQAVKVPALALSQDYEPSIGAQVSTWGFPDGYNGLAPLLSSGYFSGFDNAKGPTGKAVRRLVVNAAFNSGNSGGPLVAIENNKVIGVVASKLAPLPQYIESALKALKDQKSGFVFEKTKADGSKENVSEAQVIEEILQYLRKQTQLVIGHAVTTKDLVGFLKSKGIDP